MAADVVKIVDTGLALTASRLKGSGSEPKYVAWGTGATAAADGNTTLATESGEARTEGTTTLQTTSTAGDTYQVVGSITATAVRAIVEAGLLDSSASGTLFLRGTFDVINVNTSDSISFTVKTQYQQA